MKVNPPTLVLKPLAALMLVTFEKPKKAVPVGTVAGFQLAAALNEVEPGLASQVASCAMEWPLKTRLASRLATAMAVLV